jgi:hypothetical protein
MGAFVGAYELFMSPPHNESENIVDRAGLCGMLPYSDCLHEGKYDIAMSDHNPY